MSNWKQVSEIVGTMIDNIESRCLQEKHSSTGLVCTACRPKVTKLWVEAGGEWQCSFCNISNYSLHCKSCGLGYMACLC